MTLLGAKIQNKVRDIVLKMLLALLPPDLLFHFQIGIVFVNKFVYSSHINQAQKKQPDLMRGRFVQSLGASATVKVLLWVSDKKSRFRRCRLFWEDDGGDASEG